MPTRVIKEAYLSTPKEEWAILESVEDFKCLSLMIFNVDRKLKNRHNTVKEAVEAVRIGIQYSEYLKRNNNLTEETIKGVFNLIFFCLFYEEN